MNKKTPATEEHQAAAPEPKKTEPTAPVTTPATPATAPSPAAAAPTPAMAPEPIAAAPPPPAQPPLSELETRLAETMDKYLRARAELDNYRKRVQRDLAELREQTKAMTVQEFLPVYDYLQIAMDHAKTSTDVQALSQGMGMISSEFSRALSNLGIVPVVPAGDPFDPAAHEAVAQEPSADVPAGKIVRVWKCGFRNGEHLLRPAAVVVSSGAPAAAAKKEDPQQQNP